MPQPDSATNSAAKAAANTAAEGRSRYCGIRRCKAVARFAANAAPTEAKRRGRRRESTLRFAPQPDVAANTAAKALTTPRLTPRLSLLHGRSPVLRLMPQATAAEGRSRQCGFGRCEAGARFAATAASLDRGVSRGRGRSRHRPPAPQPPAPTAPHGESDRGAEAHRRGGGMSAACGNPEAGVQLRGSLPPLGCSRLIPTCVGGHESSSCGCMALCVGSSLGSRR